jgi:hypothetical protein
MATTELSAKKELLRALLRCPHRKLEDTVPVFRTALEQDPLFAGKCYYALTLGEFNQIRDLAESGIAFLLTSPHSIHRDAGRTCLQGLEPYRAYRVAKFIRNHLKTNRQVKGAVEDYLYTREIDRPRFDGAVRVARKALHYMYDTYHIKPGQRAQTIIFDKETPEGEADAIEMLLSASTPEEQAQLIVEYNIPYRQATSAIKSMTPAIIVALIEVMTPAEALNSRASIEASGILGDAKIRKLYEDKLKQTATDKRVATSTITERKSAKGKDEKLDKILSTARQTKIDKGARITDNTVIAVDCSGSMDVAIEIARRTCPFIASLCDAELKVICFNDTAWPLDYAGTTFEDFRKAFTLIRANGSTSLGSALKLALRQGFRPELAVYITDQEENRQPTLADVFRENNDVRFVFINVGDVHNVAKQLENAGAEVLEYDLDVDTKKSGWYSALDNLTPLLTKGGYTQLVERIMALELPIRKQRPIRKDLIRDEVISKKPPYKPAKPTKPTKPRTTKKINKRKGGKK